METDLEKEKVTTAVEDLDQVEVEPVNIKHQQVIYGLPRDKFISLLERLVGQNFTKLFEPVQINLGTSNDEYATLTLVDKTALRKAQQAQGVPPNAPRVHAR